MSKSAHAHVLENTQGTVLDWPLLKDLTFIEKNEFCRLQPPALFIFAKELMLCKTNIKFY